MEGEGSRAHALAQDAQDPLAHIRKEFIIPTKAQLKAQTLADAESHDASQGDESIYLCGNSLGLPPRLAQTRLQQHFATWSTQGVYGHFKPLADCPLPIWLDADARASELMAPIVGASPDEVAVMETLTANLHLLLAAFYKPDIKGRHKIILESKAFPSDHFAVESQIRHHNLDPSTSMILISPPPSTVLIPTDHILSIIDQHASSTAILLLPGVQFYTGQFFDIPRITAHAHSKDIFVIWDLAHAVGNVPLRLHDWDVDAAVWCTYKYINAGPGTIGGLFVHERHARAEALGGWWGSNKATRFAMDNRFVPIPGAKAFQVSNPSILDITALNASLEVFARAGGMDVLRQKSLRLTAYLEELLLESVGFERGLFEIITPGLPAERGCQLSLRLQDGFLDVVMKELEERGVVVDERRPDVVRVAPAPLFNSFNDCWAFVEAFREALDVAVEAKEGKISAEGTEDLAMTA